MEEQGVREAWELFAVDGKVSFFGKGDGRPLGGRASSVDELLRVARNLEVKNYNVYLGANPSRHHGIKAKAKDVYEWRHVIVDLDPDSVGLPYAGDVVGMLKTKLVWVLGLLVTPHVLFTGRGFQAWLPIPPVPVAWDSGAGTDGRLIERGMVGFLNRLRDCWDGALGLVVDPSVSDLSRVVRCPGTRNTKTGRTAYFIERGQPAEIADLILGMAGSEPEGPVFLGKDLTNLHQVWVHLSVTAIRFLTEGSPQSRRHHDAFAAAAALRDVGVSKEVAEQWVTRGGSLCRPVLPKDDCLRAVRSAFER